MVSDKIEMSLDDIIKSTKTMSVNKRGAGARRGGAAKGGPVRGGAARSGPSPARRQSGGRGGDAAGVQKGRNRGGGIARPNRVR